MKQIFIKALTGRGEKALRKHMAESIHLSIKNKLIFKTMGYEQAVISDEPYTISLTIKNRWGNDPSFIDLVKKQIQEALKTNKASIEKDYAVEVKNDG